MNSDVRERTLKQPAGIGASLPLFTLLTLGAAAGALPWLNGVGHTDAPPFQRAWNITIHGWQIWHGVAFSLVYFALALVHLIAGSEKSSRLRAPSLLVGGLAGFVLILVCTKWPPSVIGTVYGQPVTFVGEKVLPGCMLAMSLAILTAILGAVQLRRSLQSPANTP